MHPIQQSKPSAPLQLPAAAVVGEHSGIRKVVEEKPVVVVGRRECCMAHVARRLLLGQGANPTVFEVGDDADPTAVMDALRPPATRGKEDAAVMGHAVCFPAVFIGGRLVGGLDRLMAMHIAGELVPILKQAGALWL